MLERERAHTGHAEKSGEDQEMSAQAETELDRIIRETKLQERADVVYTVDSSLRKVGVKQGRQFADLSLDEAPFLQLKVRKDGAVFKKEVLRKALRNYGKIQFIKSTGPHKFLLQFESPRDHI